ncbi:uncharacterized protein EV422DRAFT_155062 [Fimicolochytrium jonesii]|uniref:uncharacterized protein n=1 Tax=Fimicolochytrium jonesii TaxID=1396493 RepID=UPI0022FE4CAD|nr:uncharacterized protein EV422DRAFT_155062 [Fimicolochytrium jonesii]KAI8826135.1 hypothetical protein EV422DRAFT_155062 [Fimicolochytrium jonesii]
MSAGKKFPSKSRESLFRVPSSRVLVFLLSSRSTPSRPSLEEDTVHKTQNPVLCALLFVHAVPPQCACHQDSGIVNVPFLSRRAYGSGPSPIAGRRTASWGRHPSLNQHTAAPAPLWNACVPDARVKRNAKETLGLLDMLFLRVLQHCGYRRTCDHWLPWGVA